MQMQTPDVRDLLLLGGGHSHVQVLKHFAMQPVPGVRLTLISDDYVSPYAGMVPGYIAGHYSLEEIQIALEPLCRRAGARFICAKVTGLDRDGGRVLMAGRRGCRGLTPWAVVSWRRVVSCIPTLWFVFVECALRALPVCVLSACSCVCICAHGDKKVGGSESG